MRAAIVALFIALAVPVGADCDARERRTPVYAPAGGDTLGVESGDEIGAENGDQIGVQQ